jgi:hypothetical protein
MGRRVARIALLSLCAAALPGIAQGSVLRVGSYHGIPGQFSSIQAALNAAKPGDWVLVGPGDYKTTTSSEPAGQTTFPAAVLMTTPRVHLRGMNRNAVIIDGTRPGTPVCSAKAADQNYGPAAPGGAQGLNGIMIWKAANDWVQNLTTCNFLAGPGGATAGNGVWFNGGADSGQVGGYGFLGSYLSATSTFYGGETTAAQYGIFSSNWSGGLFNQIYASNFNDSGFYIGACQQVCDQTINHGWSQYNALGYSGTNSGGQLVVENSQFDHNEDGFDTNSQNADFPPPQNGACPGNGVSPITHTHSCWVFMHNYVHDNNNPNVPSSGSAAAGPVGTGMSLSGGRNDTVMDNTFANNGAWGTIYVPYPDSGPPCTGGTQTAAACIYDESGDALLTNTYAHNGFFGNPSNGDFAATNLEPGPTDCYRGNVEAGGGSPTTSPANLQQAYPNCTGQTVTPVSNPVFLQQAACDSQSIQFAGLPGGSTCPPGANYPRRTHVTMAPLPSGLPTMPGVCAGAVPDPWCSGQVIRVSGCATGSVALRLSLAVRESFTAVSLKIGTGKTATHRAHGARATVRFALGAGRNPHVRVQVTQHLNVGRYRETVRYTRVYTRCGYRIGRFWIRGSPRRH